MAGPRSPSVFRPTCTIASISADVIVALDADLFGATTPGNVRYARDFANGRRVRRAKAEMNRLYIAEPTPTPTGAIADHRLPVRASQIEAMVRAMQWRRQRRFCALDWE